MGSLIPAVSYWALGIPITLIFVFHFTHGIRGIWYGPTCAVLLNTVAYSLVFSCIDWETLIVEARV